MKEEATQSIKDLSGEAGEAEKNNDPTLAIKLYKEIIAKDRLHIHAYDRLMKIYRQQKDYKKELSIIDSGIKAYEKFYNTHSRKASKKVSELSEKLNKSFGLIDKKGNHTYYPEPLGKWQKRKLIVNKKLSA